MSSLIKLSLIPFALFITWTSFAFLDLGSSDGNTDLLQEGTSVLYESFNNKPIHCGAYPKLEQCIDGARSSPLEKTILFGNSQLHAVNDITENAELVALRLFKSSLKRNEYALTISYGNANFEEIFWALNKVLLSLQPKRIYLSSVFDDMREVGLRPDMLEGIDDENNFQQNKVHQKRSFLPEIDFQDISETAIQRFFTDTPSWNTKHELKYRINVNLRSIRNKIFGITPETKRTVLPYAYERNMKYLSNIVSTAKKNNIEVMIYIAPLLQDTNIPYIKEEYVKYKKDVKEVAELYEAKFFNFEEIVPNQAWGLKQSTQFNSKLEKDYMHFTETGHEILANKLIESLNSK